MIVTRQRKSPLCSPLLGVLIVAGGCGTEVPVQTAAESQTGKPQQTSSKSDTEGAEHCGDFYEYGNAYFGDLHVHTSYSVDAFGVANRVDPPEAYLFAKGTPQNLNEGVLPPISPSPFVNGPNNVTINASGNRLDFMAITDHAEFLATTYDCYTPGSPNYNATFCQKSRAGTATPADGGSMPCFGPFPNSNPTFAGTQCAAELKSAWEKLKEATEAANDRCQFTSLHGYEWTLAGPNGQNQMFHRNVLFANANVPNVPLDAIAYPNPPALWNGLAQQCTEANGCDAVTIPHNSNNSQGAIFDFSSFTSNDISNMTKYQTLAEIHQSKGNSECLTDTSDTGAVSQCNFELWIGTTNAAFNPAYLRPALKRGLEYYAANGVNPLQLGFTGSTDSHTGTGGHVSESGFTGTFGRLDNTIALRLNAIPNFPQPANPTKNPGGLTGIWAEENTRESLWASLKRREVFATSGPKIKVRFYHVPKHVDNPCDDPNFPKQIVNAKDGIPMGGTFDQDDSDYAQNPPYFVVYATKDQADLSSIEIVKGTVVNGVGAEKIYDISLESQPYCVTWTDPDFDTAAPAFYYARVKEVPTERWSKKDCAAINNQAQACAQLPATIQERAWTSPIWYLPEQLEDIDDDDNGGDE